MPSKTVILMITMGLVATQAAAAEPSVVEPAVQADRDATRLGLLRAELLTQQQKFDELQKHREPLVATRDEAALKQADTGLGEVSHNIEQLQAEIAATQGQDTAPLKAKPARRAQPQRARPPVDSPAPWWDLYSRKPNQEAP